MEKVIEEAATSLRKSMKGKLIVTFNLSYFKDLNWLI